MGRQLRRVPLNFDWPLHKPWRGFINEYYGKCHDCPSCDGTGYSPDAKLFSAQWYGTAPFDPRAYGAKLIGINDEHLRTSVERKIAWSQERSKQAGEREWYTHGGTVPLQLAVDAEVLRMHGIYKNQWAHHLVQADVDALVEGGRLMDFTHDFVRGDGWNPKEPPVVPTADEVNAWSLTGMAHDACNQWACVKARCERKGVSDSCDSCGGEGSVWESSEAKQIADDWEESDPPEGTGYQLWETVSEGSPITPVFSTADELACHLVENDDSVTSDTTFDQWMEFINGPGWAPSLVIDGGAVKSGIQAVL